MVVLAPARRLAAGLSADTMLASYLLDATRSGRSRSGDTPAPTLGYKALTEEAVCGRGAESAHAWRNSAFEARSTTPGERADLPLQLADQMTPQLAPESLDSGVPGSGAARSSVLAALGAGVRIWGCVGAPGRARRIASSADLRAGRRGVQHQLAEAASRDAVRKLQAAGAAGHGKTGPRRQQWTCSKSSRSRTICRG